jgi:hypothetical protein
VRDGRGSPRQNSGGRPDIWRRLSLAPRARWLGEEPALPPIHVSLPSKPRAHHTLAAGRIDRRGDHDIRRVGVLNFDLVPSPVELSYLSPLLQVVDR